MFSLIFTEGGQARRAPLASGDTIVGRSVGCDLVINDPRVSRRHARFSVTESRCAVTDLGSLNGVYRYGEPVASAALKDGDIVVLGGLPVRVEESLADQLHFSDRAMLEVPGTIIRPIPSREATGTASTVRSNGPLPLLSAIAGVLVGGQPLNDVLEHIVDLTFGTIPAERAVLILTAESGDLVPRVVRHRDRSMPGSVSLSRTIVNQVVESGVAILAADVWQDQKFQAANSILNQAIRSFMCIPLRSQDSVIGVLYVDAPQRDRFSTDDLDLFTAMSNYAAVAIEQARLNKRLLEETRRRERLQRYHSPGVVNRILETGDDADAPFLAQERDVSVLFADIVGFTTLAETMSPAEVAQLLNTYLAGMTDAIFDQQGTLDKFIGDAVMGVFGAPFDQPDHALRAVRAAQSMRAVVARLNEGQSRRLELRIAVNSGLALAGDMGSPKRREYTVLGDVVNTASRLEAITPPGEIRISRATYDRLHGDVAVRSQGAVNLRGRMAEIEVFDVIG